MAIREWWADFDHLYHRQMAGHLAHHETFSAASTWHNERARSIAMDPGGRLETCGRRWRKVRCGCKSLQLPVGCGAPWCDDCTKKKSRRLRRKVVRALNMNARAHRRTGYREKKHWTMITLTPPGHSGSLDDDRKAIIDGWKKTRTWLHADVGQFPFVMTWECTDGADGHGHIHAHVVALLPFIDWARLQAEWKTATGCATAHLHCAVTSTRKAAGYIAKYATKGVSPTSLRAEVAAKYVRASYNKRSVNVSEKFWCPLDLGCKNCGEEFEVTMRPQSLREAATDAVRASFYRRIGLALDVAPTQKLITWKAKKEQPD